MPGDDYKGHTTYNTGNAVIYFQPPRFSGYSAGWLVRGPKTFCLSTWIIKAETSLSLAEAGTKKYKEGGEKGEAKEDG